MSYIIGSGFYRGSRHPLNVDAFAELWAKSVAKQCAAACHVFIVEHATCYPTRALGHIPRPVSIIPAANLGHVHQYVGAQNPPESGPLCGWSASILLLALTAFNKRADLFYVEQDALLFGDCVGKIQREIGSRQLMFGSWSRKGVVGGIAQSVFYLRWSWIPTFVQHYLSLWPDTDNTRRPEGKFADIERRHPGHVGRYSFGVDRDRPLPWDAPIWYAQQWTQAELDEVQQRGLL